ncbi:adenylyl-sulfate kinase [Spirosoma luteum]|uniref:adenylyl-sulfate kinase n=1 Tax=Spirosoma luteum TaxID=431553 RepID=UPI00037265D1|nr:adenylyl-sulfate kinase [Spirosoma luteum]
MVFVQLTGLSGAGKTTLAYGVQKRLQRLGYSVEVLDGDECRSAFWPELGFSPDDRQENLRRMGLLAHWLTRHGILVLLAAINPYQKARDELSRQNQPAKTVFVDCGLETLIQRDTKGLYARALLPDNHPDKLRNLTGINAPYEAPITPDLIIQTDQYNQNDCEEQLSLFILTALNNT